MTTLWSVYFVSVSGLHGVLEDIFYSLQLVLICTFDLVIFRRLYYQAEKYKQISHHLI